MSGEAPTTSSTSSPCSSAGSLTGADQGWAAPAGSSVTVSTSAPYRASIPSQIDPMALTTASWLTLNEIAFPMSLGYSEREVARGLGVPKKQVATRLAGLREELMGQ